MLQFWKKNGQNNQNSSKPVPANVLTSNEKIAEDSSTRYIDQDHVNKNPIINCDDEGWCDIGDLECPKSRSTSLKTLSDVLSDKNALNYFIHFMDSRGSVSHIHCWLDIDTYKSDVPRKITSPIPSHNVDHDSLSVSTDCDSFTADSNSLCDYPTATVSECKASVSQEFSICERESDISTSSKYNKNIIEDLSSSDKKHLVDNAVNIFKKYVAQEALHSIKCPEEIRRDVIENICDTKNILLGNTFDKVQNFVFSIMERDYFELFLASDYYCKHQIDVLTSGHVVLDDILYNETALFYFMEFLEQESNKNILEFWIAATNLHQQLLNRGEFFDPIEAQNDAVVLYDKYFSLQAHCPLGFTDKVRFAVEQSICGEHGVVADCFHLPIRIIESILDKNYLKSFLASQLFYKFLSDLINTVQSNGYSTNIRNHKRSPSDADSEKSFASSTFLALEIDQNSAKKHDTSNMSIDTRELYDPDVLWKRKRNPKLTCGRMTNLGKYETEFEPEPDRKGFNLKNVVRKFVSLEEEEKRKEEMAWQVAEMIVKDITNVTLNDHIQDIASCM